MLSKGLLKESSVFLTKTSQGENIPVLVMNDLTGKPFVVKEVLEYCQSQMYSQKKKIQTIRAEVVSIAHFLEYIKDHELNTLSTSPGKYSVVADMLYRFIQLRSKNPSLANQKTVASTTIERDRKALVSFAEFCASTINAFPLPHLNMAPLPFVWMDKEHAVFMQRFGRKQLVLRGAIQWSSNKNNKAGSLKQFYSIQKTPSVPRYIPTKAEIEAIIQATPSLAHKLIFILGAFGGSRISEILHMWVCDVLPGSRRKKLIPSDENSEVPCVLLADPLGSTYVDLLDSKRESRQNHLQRVYGLVPRHKLPPTDGYFLGWKGMIVENPTKQVSQIYWSNYAWANTFWGIFEQYRDNTLVLVKDTARKNHPYLFVNDSNIRNEYLLPVKLSNIRKAFARACKNAGLDPKVMGGIHALRHFYKATLKQAGLEPSEIKIAMHHRSVESQEHYAISHELDIKQMHKKIQQQGEQFE